MTEYQTPKYLLSPQHPITIDLIGVGGNGSHVLMGLAYMHNALIGMGHPGFHVTAYDMDKVEEHNVGRQHFSSSDIGFHKASALITRINRMYGFKWGSRNSEYNSTTPSNITISCVDSIKSRKKIGIYLKNQQKKSSREGYYKQYFWIDCGNNKDTGQIILGTKIDAEFHLPNFLERFPNVEDTGDDTPSCSMHESLFKQDLNINRTIALYTNDLLWRILRTGKVQIAGMYINHRLYQISPISILPTT